MALPADPALPLADLKVLDFSWAGVGPITVKYLADHGATVVRVESHARYDVVRLGPPWHDGKPGIERSQFYASYNTSKLGIALDLSKPEARAIARRIAAWADVGVGRRGGGEGGCAAPDGGYPCGGDDRWIALSVRGEAEWRALCSVLAEPAWLGDARVVTHAARVVNAEALDALVAAATRSLEAS